MINNDFSFNNVIERAFSFKNVMAQKFLLEKVMQLNHEKYSNFIIQILGMVFRNPELNHNVSYILEFFRRKKDISVNN
jgi:hypothetical protein